MSSDGGPLAVCRGYLLGATAVGGVIGPTLTGLIFDTLNSYLYAWVGLAIAATFSAFLMLVTTRGKKPA